MLIPGPPPPPDPPLEGLTHNPVATDPRKRVYALEEERGEAEVVRLVWDADDPEVLEAELRTPGFGHRPGPEEIRRFWAWVRETVRPIGPLPVEAADPRP